MIKKSFTNAAFLIAVAIFVTIGLLDYRSMNSFGTADFWQMHTYQVIAELDNLLVSITEAESSQRGYIISGNESYLEPYHQALGRISAIQQSVKELTKDNPQQQKRLDRLAAVTQIRLAEMAYVLELRQKQGAAAATQRILQHYGKKHMDEVRSLVAEAQQEETALLKERTAKKQTEAAKTLQVLEIGGGIALVILLTVFFLLNAQIAERARAEAALSDRNEELERTRDRERLLAWVKEGVNELNDVIRGDKPLDVMTHDALSFLCRYVNAGLGALYLFEERAQTLALSATYAFSPGVGVHSIQLGEGVAGEAARQKSAITIDDVPDGYAIGSTLGGAAPRTLRAVPLSEEKRLVGVIELGRFTTFNDTEIDFLDLAAEALAVTLSAARARQMVTELLQQSRVQEEELRVQQEELQQSNEELEERAQLLEQQREQIHVKNREMEEAAREIMRKARELEQISTYKSEFLANMSHELRTPLNSLMILSGHLQDNREGNLTAKQVEYAATIKSAGTDLLNLINDILDLSKIEAGRLEYVYEETPVEELARQLETMFRPLADQKGLEFRAVIDEGVPPTMHLDAQRTLQVLKNLIANAIKFTAQGSVTLRIYPPSPEDNPLPMPAVAFAVADTGIGIPKEKHELIFQAFQQVDGSTSRRFGGTGLGLSISRELTHAMNGTILVSGDLGQGSVFTLYLPVSGASMQPGTAKETMGAVGTEAQAEALTATAPESMAAQARGALMKAAQAKAPQAAAPSAAPVEGVQDDREEVRPGGRCILIIEDDPTFAGLMMEKVRERGFAALVASDGNSGMELAEKYLPSAVLLDVMLPGMDGWGVMQKMNENPHVRHIPVHFVTCVEEKQKALAMGAIGFVVKPVSGEELDRVFGAVEEAVSKTVRKLLIVEDDKAQATALVALLEERDIAITVAQSGVQAIELLGREPFDCIVLDLGLADMSGFDLLEHIRNLEESRRVPVIIHTGQELSQEDTARLQRYAESVIIKGAKSPERLLNEVTLFLHVMESKLPPDKQRMIRRTLDNEALLAGKKVLLVDDDMRNIFSLSSVLSEKGMQVVEAENGRVALERLEEHPDISVILMDVMMPEMDGYEATRRIRKDSRFAAIPVIALTAKAMKGDREACLRAGASDYITKPVDVDRLLSLLRVWLYNQG